jgi:hypothetical protein
MAATPDAYAQEEREIAQPGYTDLRFSMTLRKSFANSL